MVRCSNTALSPAGLPNRVGIPSRPKGAVQPSVPPTYEQWSREDTPVLDFVTSVVGNLVGTGNGARLAVVTASAGGAHGAVHAAQIPKENHLLIMAANLAAAGAATANYATAMSSIPNALGVAVRAGVAAVQMGVETWSALPMDTKQRVFSGTEALTDKILPEQASPSVPQRLGRGLVGEAAGAAVGGAVGFLSGLASGRVFVQDFVDLTQKAIYRNMHEPSDLQRQHEVKVAPISVRLQGTASDVSLPGSVPIIIEEKS